MINKLISSTPPTTATQNESNPSNTSTKHSKKLSQSTSVNVIFVGVPLGVTALSFYFKTHNVPANFANTEANSTETNPEEVIKQDSNGCHSPVNVTVSQSVNLREKVSLTNQYKF